jgi:hypothetical protein
LFDDPRRYERGQDGRCKKTVDAVRKERENDNAYDRMGDNENVKVMEPRYLSCSKKNLKIP